MSDAENDIPSSKKRVAGRQISKDDPSLDDDTPETEMGTFKRASDEVLATRRIVKVKRHQPPPSSSSNPFAGICLVSPAVPSAKADNISVQPQAAIDKSGDGETPGNGGTENERSVNEANGMGDSNKTVDVSADIKTTESGDKVENAVEKAKQPVKAGNSAENGENTDTKSKEPAEEHKKEIETETAEMAEEAVFRKIDTEDGGIGKEKQEGNQEEKSEAVAHLSSFKQLSSSQNAFTGLAGTGFSVSSCSFGTVSKNGSAACGSAGSLFGFKGENPSLPLFGGNPINGSSFRLFGSCASGSKDGSSGKTSMQEVPTKTGEENEKTIFTADALLYEYLDGGWKERGKGELKLNVSTLDDEKARLIMRARGNYRLILNASLYADISLKNMDKKGITFACINSAADGKGGLSTFALKFKDASFVEEFCGAVTAHKGKKAAIMKMPENSPKASKD